MTETSAPARTALDHDNTGVARLTGLKPDTRYHYRIQVEERPHELPGSFRTLPSAETTRNSAHNPKGLFYNG